MVTIPAGDGSHEASTAPQRGKRLNAEQRRQDLLDAANRVIRRVGPQVTASQIAEEAHVTKPIIYRHFGDIQDLYRELAEQHAHRLEQLLNDARVSNAHLDPYGRFRTIVLAFLDAVEAEPNLYEFLIHMGADHSTERGALSWFMRIWAERWAGHIITIRGYPAGAPVPTAMGYAMAGALTTVGNWWLTEQSATKDEVATAVTEVLIAGLLNTSSRR